MTRILDCLVNYFGLDEEERPAFGRYFCYHIIAGPGPTAEAGVASITTLAIYDEHERCLSCQNFHVVETGGPAAAITKAIRYLDAYHAEDRVRRVQSEIRGLSGDAPAEASSLAVPPPFRVRSPRQVGNLPHDLPEGTTVEPVPLPK
jgi:hypothetical protein